MRRILLGILLFCCAALDAKPLNVSVRAGHAILYNPENGAILFEKGAREPHYPASILKIATALFILDRNKIDLNKRLVADPEVLEIINADVKQSDFLLYPPYLLEHDGVLMGLKKGKDYSIRTLLHGILLASGNDAANVLAQGISGSIDAFMGEMNAYLKSKGIVQTRFQNPSGLHHPAQITTAYDMAQIAALCFENELFREIIGTLDFESPSSLNIRNTNRMLKKGKYHYPPFIGGKTGYIASSGYNLVAAAEEKGRRLIVVVMGCETNEDRFKDAITLFETAFCQKQERRTLFSKDHPGFKRELSKAKEPLIGLLQEDVAISYYPAEEVELSTKLIWGKVRLPIREGDEVGKIVVSNPRGDVMATCPLYAKADVLKSSSRRWPYLLLILASGFGLIQLFIKRRKFIGR